MIIGICGFQSSGKDTIANYLIEHHGFIKMSFASALKDVVAIVFGWSREKLEGITVEDREWRETPDKIWSQALQMDKLTPRQAMRIVATDLFRNNLHPEIWVKIVEHKLNTTNKNINVVITDCRFQNEIDMVLKSGGKIINVLRNVPNWFDKYKKNEKLTEIETNELNTFHCSEIEWIKCHCDYEIFNNGTINELFLQMEYILQNIDK